MVSEENRHNAPILPASWWRMLLLTGIAVCGVVIGYIIFERYLRVAATILVLAAMLTYLLQPVVEWMVRVSRMRDQHTARVSAVLFIYLALATGLCFLGSGIAQPFITDGQRLLNTWVTARHHAPQQLLGLQSWYQQWVPAEVQAQITEAIKHEIQRFPDKYIPLVVERLTGIASALGAWVGMIIELIFVPLVAFYFLTDSTRVREQVLFFIPRRHRDKVLRYASGMNRIMRRYVHSQLILCAIAWAVVTLALLIMNIPGALLLGVIAGLARAIPVVGPVVGGIPVLGAVLLDPQWAHAFWWVLIGFTALHLFESKFLMPRILGDCLDVHPVLVIISLLLGYELLGLLGMFVAPPVVAIIRFILAVRRNEISLADAPDQCHLPETTPSMPDEVPRANPV